VAKMGQGNNKKAPHQTKMKGFRGIYGEIYLIKFIFFVSTKSPD
jgi:hypothetical protein